MMQSVQELLDWSRKMGNYGEELENISNAVSRRVTELLHAIEKGHS